MLISSGEVGRARTLGLLKPIGTGHLEGVCCADNSLTPSQQVIIPGLYAELLVCMKHDNRGCDQCFSALHATLHQLGGRVDIRLSQRQGFGTAVHPGCVSGNVPRSTTSPELYGGA